MKWLLFLFVASASAAPIDYDALIHTAFTEGGDRAAKQAALATFKANKPEAAAALLNYSHLRHHSINYWAHFLSRHTASNEVARLSQNLRPFLEAEHHRTRNTACLCLSLHPNPSLAMEVALLLRDARTAGNALRFLGKAKAPNTLALITPFTKNKPERLRIFAVNALGDLGNPDAVPTLVTALDDPIFTVRHAAIRALVRLAPSPEILNPADPPVRSRRALAEVFGRLGQAGIPSLETLLSDPDESVRTDAKRWLAIARGDSPLP